MRKSDMDMIRYVGKMENIYCNLKYIYIINFKRI